MQFFRKSLGRAIAAACFGALPALLPLSAQATKVMDFQPDQIMFIANELKGTLNLTPNQLTLWQQVSGKAASLLHTRQLRRDRLQAELKRRLAEADPDLRALTAGVDEEAALASAEDRQLRELWLSMNDALDDKQRLLVVQLVASQLERVDADPQRGQRPSGGRESQGRGGPGGGRGQRSGGMGGMGGGGGMGGPGG